MRSCSSFGLGVDVHLNVQRISQLLHLLTDFSVELDVLPNQAAYFLLERVDHLILLGLNQLQTLILSF